MATASLQAALELSDVNDSGNTDESPSNKWHHPPSFYCPISQQCMHDPVVLSDGHSYERRYIERWLSEKSTSPVNGLQLDHLAVFPNHSLRNAIEEYFQQVFSAHRRAIRKTITSPEGCSQTSLLRTIDALMQCTLLMGADLSMEMSLRQIMAEAKTLLGADAASVFLVDAESQELVSEVNSTGEVLRIPIWKGIAGHVATTGEPVIIRDAYQDARFNKTVDKNTGYRTRSIMCAPLKVRGGNLIGVVQLINKGSKGALAPMGSRCRFSTDSEDDELCFSADDLNFLQVFAAQAATAVATSTGFFEPEVQRSEPIDAAEVPQKASDSSVPGPSLPPAASELLEQSFDTWELDSLQLAKLTDDKPLSSLGPFLFEKLGLVEHFGLDNRKLAAFFTELELGYDRALGGEVPYHNRAHGASVLHGMHAMLQHCGLAEVASRAFAEEESESLADGSGKLETLACLLAAAVHDYEHTGVNNDFLVKTSDERATRYNDQHVNENHHAAAAFALLQRSELDFLSALPKKAFTRLRSLVIELVLGTDMARSGTIIDGFKEILPAEPSTAFAPKNAKEAVLLLQMAMKCSDLGHLALPWEIHLAWVRRLEAEFFAQGDREKDLGLPVSFLMDRNKPGASETQVGFFDFVVLPLFRLLQRAAPSAAPLLASVVDNHEAWKTSAGEPTAAVEIDPTASTSTSDLLPMEEGDEEEHVVRKKRSGRARQRAAKFWRSVRVRTPSPW